MTPRWEKYDLPHVSYPRAGIGLFVAGGKLFLSWDCCNRKLHETFDKYIPVPAEYPKLQQGSPDQHSLKQKNRNGNGDAGEHAEPKAVLPGLNAFGDVFLVGHAPSKHVLANLSGALSQIFQGGGPILLGSAE